MFELDPDGRQLRVITVTEYTADRVRTLYPNAADLRAAWQEPEKRAAVIAALAERGIDFDTLASAAGQPEADPFDLLCHVAFNAPLRTRRERADRLKRERRTSSTSLAPMPARRAGRGSWRSTPSSARRSSYCPTCWRCRRSRNRVT